MSEMTVITDRVVSVAGRTDRQRGSILVDPGDLDGVLGWELTPAGLCRGDRCVPVRDVDAVQVDGSVDLAAVADAVGLPSVIDLDVGIMAVALPAERRHRTLHDREAPDVTLPDLDEVPRSLSDWAGRKRLLVAFASWCGCRYELPGWQALHDELSPLGFTVVAVAIDQRADDVRPFAEGLTIPVLYDSQHLLPELFAISNVPTVVWIDEDGRIVRPNAEAFGTDLFTEFTGAVSGPHLDLVRRWVRNGEIPEQGPGAWEAVGDLSGDEVLARLHFRIAAETHRRGDPDATRRHVLAAGALAPDDLTVWRAGMPLLGEDPFGQDFLDRYDEWKRRGSPAHALPSLT